MSSGNFSTHSFRPGMDSMDGALKLPTATTMASKSYISKPSMFNKDVQGERSAPRSTMLLGMCYVQLVQGT